jgi:lipopolysaccharide transport system ATP-binding protein
MPSIPNLNSSQRGEDEVLVRVEGVSKKFCRDLKKSLWYGVCDIASELLPVGQRNELSVAGGENSEQAVTRYSSPDTSLRKDEFFAVKDVSFELKRGECLGLIGRNGAGKTTLLKMLNGLIKPDSGRIEMRGRIGALIALGAGFNPILTGRENVYVYGSVLGLTKKEIDEKFDEIMEYSDLHQFINSPVRSYSSGMQVRLGFAVAVILLQPDVLLLDEVLAVGDAQFRAKCFNTVSKLMGNSAVIFVSHNIDQVAQMSNRGLFLEDGKQIIFGDLDEAVRAYTDRGTEGDAASRSESFLKHAESVETVQIILENDEELEFGGIVKLTIDIELNKSEHDCLLRIPFYYQDGRIAAEYNSRIARQDILLKSGKNRLMVQLGPINLKQGDYYLGILINDSTRAGQLFWSYKQTHIRISGAMGSASFYQLNGIIRDEIK